MAGRRRRRAKPSRGQGVPATLREILIPWALTRTDPFTPEEAWDEVGRHLRPPVTRRETEQALAEDPQIVLLEGACHTPRILASGVPFIIRLLSEERDKGILIPGHRFLPFVPAHLSPANLRIIGPGGAPLPELLAEVSQAAAAACHNLYGPRGERMWRRAARKARAKAVRLVGLDAPGGEPPGELLVTCADFDGRCYEVRRYDAAGDRPGGPDRYPAERLAGALIEVLADPPPGPRIAPRQILQAVAACREEIGDRPVGPIGPILTGRPEVRLEEGEQGAVFVPNPDAPAGPERPASGAAPSSLDLDDLARILREELRVTPARLFSRGEGIVDRVRSVRWAGRTSSFLASVQGTAPSPYRVTIAIDPDLDLLGPDCTCPYFEDHETCKHVVAVLLAILDGAGGLPEPDPNARRRNRQPAWMRRLRRADEVLGREAGRRREQTTDRRVVWRIEEDVDGIDIVPVRQRRLRSGRWSKGTRVALSTLAAGGATGASDADREAAADLLLTGGRPLSWSHVDHGDAIVPFTALERLVGHPAVFWEDDRETPVEIGRGEVRLHLREGPGGEIIPAPVAGGLVGGVDASVLMAPGGLVFLARSGHRVVLARTGDATLDLLYQICHETDPFPPEARDPILARLQAIETILPVDLPEGMAGDPVDPDGRVRILLTPGGEGGGVTAEVRVRPLPPPVAPYAPGEGPGDVRGLVDGRRVRARRDLEGEKERARGVAGSIGLDPAVAASPWRWSLDDETALDLIARVQESGREDVVLEWPEGAGRMLVTREALPDSMRVTVRQRRDWFGIGGDVQVDDESAPLQRVLAEIRRGRRHVPLGGGKWMRISERLRRRLGPLAHLGTDRRTGLEVGRAAAPVIAEAIREAGSVQGGREWREMEGRMDRVRTLRIDPPEGFRGTLRPYQVAGYRWMRRLAEMGAGGCLADDMGLGKTLQALAVLLDRAGEGPALVVAPVSVGTNWVREIRRFAPGLRPVLYRETARSPEAMALGAGDVVVTSYGLLRRDADRLAGVPWNSLILDEAQAIKNARTKTARAVRGIDAGWRFALTGTPIENRLGELWSIFRAISPGLLGSWDQFRDRFARPIERDRDASRREALARVIRPFVLRRTKGEVLRDLPPRSEVVLTAELPAAERRVYDAARIEAADRLGSPDGDGDSDRRFEVLAAITRLRQIACHPRLVYPDLHLDSAKLGLFLETVEEIREEGHRALVFSQFTRYLSIVREALEARGIGYLYLDGKTPARRRDETVDAFQRGEADLFLISLKAGGTGLNLTAADYVIHLDPWWNPAVEDQATDRAHRIGQTRPVFVYRLVAGGTIEEQILSLHAEKRDLVAGVLDGTDAAGKLSTEELIDLIRSADRGAGATRGRRPKRRGSSPRLAPDGSRK